MTTEKLKERAERRLGGMVIKTKDDVEKAFSLAKDEDDTASIYTLLFDYPDVRKSLHEVWADIALFYENSDNKLLNKLVKRQLRRNERADFFMKYQNRNLTGIQLVDSSKSIGAVFLPDASEPGRYRVSYFDCKGFFSHSTADSYNELIEKVWEMGCKNEDDLISSFSTKQEWAVGSEQTLLLQSANAGQISYLEYKSEAEKVGLRQKIANKLVVMYGEPAEEIILELRTLLNGFGYDSTALSYGFVDGATQFDANAIAQGLFKIQPQRNIEQADDLPGLTCGLNIEP